MRYEHDCNNCVPLGQHKECDLYFCKQGGSADTIVARFGSEGPDYMSGMIPKGLSEPLDKGRKLAESKGLIDGE